MQTATSSGGLGGLAKVLASRGRGGDSLLVHMTPGEVGGLQALALAHGGSLTVNPDTGLPEAGFLGDILPTLLGVGMNFILPGSGLLVAGLVGGGTALATGDLGKGLMAGLGAFGGASLGAGLFGSGVAGAGEAGASGLFGGLKESFGRGILGKGAEAGATAPGSGGLLGKLLGGGAEAAAPATGLAGVPQNVNSMLPMQTSPLTGAVQSNIAPTGQGLAGATPPSFLQEFVGTASGMNPADVGTGLGAISGPNSGSLLRTGAATMGALQPLNALGSRGEGFKEEESKYPYKGPYMPAPRELTFPTSRGIWDTSEYRYFSPTNPVPSTMPYAGGGGVNLKDGGFVVDARTVAEVGNGSSNAGQELLAGYGGTPIRGPGNGASDSIPANIGGLQQARLARDEVVFDPRAVRNIGDGNQSRGTAKLYNLMERARAARRGASRGDNSGLMDRLLA
jgi:hypothetical protein